MTTLATLLTTVLDQRLRRQHRLLHLTPRRRRWRIEQWQGLASECACGDDATATKVDGEHLERREGLAVTQRRRASRTTASRLIDTAITLFIRRDSEIDHLIGGEVAHHGSTSLGCSTGGVGCHRGCCCGRGWSRASITFLARATITLHIATIDLGITVGIVSVAAVTIGVDHDGVGSFDDDGSGAARVAHRRRPHWHRLQHRNGGIRHREVDRHLAPAPHRAHVPGSMRIDSDSV